MAFTFAKSLSRLNGCVRLGNRVKISGLEKRYISGCANNLQRNNVVHGSISEFDTSYKINNRYFCSSTVSERKIPKKKLTLLCPDEWPSVPIVPIKSTPLIPGYIYRFKLTDKKLIEEIKKKMQEDERYVGMFLVKDEKNEAKTIKSKDDLYPTGTFAQVSYLRECDDHTEMVVFGNRRISIYNFHSENNQKIEGGGGKSEDMIHADIDNVTLDLDFVDSEVKKLSDEVKKIIKDIVGLGSENVMDDVGNENWMDKLIPTEHGRAIFDGMSYPRFYDPIHLGDYAAFLTRETAEPKELQQVLEERNIKKRLELCLTLLKKDFEWRSKPENRNDETFLINVPKEY